MNRYHRPTARLGSFGVSTGALVASLVAAGCQTSAVPGVPGSPPTGASLFALISQTDPYQQWAQFPGRQGTLPSAQPHGPMSRVWINDKVKSALTNFTGQLPDGSIIVKENVGSSSQITEAALTVMWKVAGFDPAGNDWFWANMTPDGQVVAEGNVQGCSACHGGVRSNDFVFVHRF